MEALERTNPAMPARYTRNQAAARNAVALYYRQLSLFDNPSQEGGPAAEQPMFTDEKAPISTTNVSQNPRSEQRYAG